MGDSQRPANATSFASHAPGSTSASNSSLRPRFRKPDRAASDLVYFDTPVSSRDPSPSAPSIRPVASPRAASDSRVPGRQRSPVRSVLGQPPLEASWSSSWLSVQEFASSLLGPKESPKGSTGGRCRSPTFNRSPPSYPWKDGLKHRDSWGPDPSSRFPTAARGGLPQDRNAATSKTAKTASVLENHYGANGRLDALGRYKRRSSEDGATHQSGDADFTHQTVYVHHVEPADTFAGVMLKYGCRADELRRANGLWSRDNIQIRSWLFIPVDACECVSTPLHDLLYSIDECPATSVMREPNSSGTLNQRDGTRGDHMILSPATAGSSSEPQRSEPDRPWVHTQWVTLESFGRPVEVARISRRNLGYFPPRRKKSLGSLSTLSTPRQSTDLAAAADDSPDTRFLHWQRDLRHSPQWPSSSDILLAVPDRGRANSGTGNSKLGWMKGPGGVGSLGSKVKAPGPEGDYLNSWIKRHIPSLNTDLLQSMSITGSESASLSLQPPLKATIVEHRVYDEHGVVHSANHSSGLEKAATAVETWLRGALTIRSATPQGGQRTRGQDDGDLIELEDATDDSSRWFAAPADADGSSRGAGTALGSAGSSSGRPAVEGLLRGRGPDAGSGKGKKSV